MAMAPWRANNPISTGPVAGTTPLGHGPAPFARYREVPGTCPSRTSPVSRVRETRTYGLKGGAGNGPTMRYRASNRPMGVVAYPGTRKRNGSCGTNRRLRTGLVFGMILFLVAAVPVVAGPRSEPSVELRVPDTVRQGEPIAASVRVNGARVEEVDVLLFGSGGEKEARVAAVGVAPRGRERESEEQWAAILGVSSTAEPGGRSVEARVHFPRYSMIARSDVMVEEGDFFSMDISLNRELTALLTEPDPEREEQRRELRQLLASSDPAATYNPGTFQKPVEAQRVSADFGDRRVYRYADGTSSRSIHNGIDYVAQPGTAVHAAGHGRIRLAAERVVSGKSVVIEHMPGLFSLYYHLDSLDVAEGQFVLAGDRIGTVGATGLATGPHLHWEVQIARTPVDPEWFFDNAVLQVAPITTQ